MRNLLLGPWPWSQHITKLSRDAAGLAFDFRRSPFIHNLLKPLGKLPAHQSPSIHWLIGYRFQLFSVLIDRGYTPWVKRIGV
ncbi:hypothetical protein [Candidatus Thiodiazotropha endoloripes]|uniref:hypothetical protein n=1 Tax=Candidatus Thiodiazotropha endoloripes TaxID=1818881 RepID=UPI00114C953C|nr:hypothetical protein [Candidatus Thiodiazotropha endoloripes]